MQEIAIIISSLAGVATAAAARRMPRNKTQLLSLGASSHIKNQINSLKIEKDILTKTISRLYQTDSDFPKIQRDKLLLKYQHQLGIILARLEKLEVASHHPDLGPVGDGLITLMDQKLSRLDDRLYELSSKITTLNAPISEIKKEEVVEKKPEVKPNRKTFDFEKPEEIKLEPIIIPHTGSRQLFELTTLTKFSNREPKFPLFEKPIEPKQQIIQEIIKPKDEIIQEIVKPKIEDKIEIIQAVTAKSEIKFETKPDIDNEVAKITERKALPEPKKSTQVTAEDNFDEDSSDDLDKIKGEIMKVLSKIEQAEVE